MISTVCKGRFSKPHTSGEIQRGGREVFLHKGKGLGNHFRCFYPPCWGKEAGAWGGGGQQASGQEEGSPRKSITLEIHRWKTNTVWGGLGCLEPKVPNLPLPCTLELKCPEGMTQWGVAGGRVGQVWMAEGCWQKERSTNQLGDPLPPQAGVCLTLSACYPVWPLSGLKGGITYVILEVQKVTHFLVLLNNIKSSSEILLTQPFLRSPQTSALMLPWSTVAARFLCSAPSANDCHCFPGKDPVMMVWFPLGTETQTLPFCGPSWGAETRLLSTPNVQSRKRLTWD